MLTALAVTAGVLLVLLAPRFRPHALIVFALLLACAGFVAAALAGGLAIGTGALLLGGALLAAAVLARAVPRVLLFLLLFVAIAGAVPLQALGAARWAMVLLGLGALAASVLLAIKADVGMHVACALLGATLIVRPFSPPRMPLIILAVALALLTASAALRRREPAPEVSWAGALLTGILLGALGAGGVLLAWSSAQPLPIRGPAEARHERIAAVARHGGLLWPLPSEAIFWGDDADVLPWFPNLDAAWLGGEPRGLWKLPGTSLRGRLALSREVVALRRVKDASEIEALRAAAAATIGALRDVLPMIREGTKEAAIADALRAAHLRRGCSGESFPAIVAGGASAAEPHGSGNKGVLRDGELVMIDTGCLLRGYASDVTRTFPVSGRFTERQRKIYDAVYEAQQASLKACRPGLRLSGPRDPNSLDGIARAAIRARGFEDDNPYGVGHSIGLFVHDPPLGLLAPRMAFTLEPGIYVEGELGVRIEDTYVVEASRCRSISEGLPADAASIEAALAKARAR